MSRADAYSRGDHGWCGRPPLPAGSPETWALLVRGTCLEGTPYPHPVFAVPQPSASQETP